MRKNLQYKCNTALLQSPTRVSCPNTPVVSVDSVQIILQIFVFKWHFEIPEKCLLQFFYTAFPLRFTNTKKVVCSVSNAKTTVDK